jgi:hypothetical protein
MQEKATKKEDSFGLTRGYLYVRVLKVKIAACFRIRRIFCTESVTKKGILFLKAKHYETICAFKQRIYFLSTVGLPSPTTYRSREIIPFFFFKDVFCH